MIQRAPKKSSRPRTTKAMMRGRRGLRRGSLDEGPVTPGISGMSGRKRVGGGVSAIAKNDCTVMLAGGANGRKEDKGEGEEEAVELVIRRQGLAGHLFPCRLRPSVVRSVARGKSAEDGERHTIIGPGVCSQSEHSAEIRTSV